MDAGTYDNPEAYSGGSAGPGGGDGGSSPLRLYLRVGCSLLTSGPPLCVNLLSLDNIPLNFESLDGTHPKSWQLYTLR